MATRRSTSGTCPTKQSTKKRLMSQTRLSFGHQGPSKCKQCLMVYQKGEDDAAHKSFHERFSKSVLYRPSTVDHSEYCSDETKGRIYSIASVDFSRRWPLLESLFELMNADLGGYFDDVHSAESVSAARVYICVSPSKRIIGCVLVKEIQHATRLKDSSIQDLIRVEGESVSCRLGIEAVWAHHSARRQGIASLLVKSIISGFYYGESLAPEDLAFSQLTRQGLAFAHRVCDGRVNVYLE